MRLTRIDFEGSSKRPGHYATAQRRAASGTAPNVVVVTILTPDMPDGREHHVTADCEDDLRSMAECLQHQLDGYTGSNSEINDYYLELLKLSNC